jgi:hypothetical protein
MVHDDTPGRYGQIAVDHRVLSLECAHFYVTEILLKMIPIGSTIQCFAHRRVGSTIVVGWTRSKSRIN